MPRAGAGMPPARRETVNAIGLIVSCLLASKVTTPAETAYLEVLAKLHAATDGSAPGHRFGRRPVHPADHHRRHNWLRGRPAAPEL